MLRIFWTLICSLTDPILGVVLLCGVFSATVVDVVADQEHGSLAAEPSCFISSRLQDLFIATNTDVSFKVV
jgi:hypothetical protein